MCSKSRIFKKNSLVTKIVMTHFLRLFLSIEFKYDHENCSKFSEKAKQRKIYINHTKCCYGKLKKVFDLQPKTNTPGSDKVCL